MDQNNDVCNCPPRRKVRFDVTDSDVMATVVYCRVHGKLSERFSCAADSLPDFLRRVLPRSMFLPMAEAFAKEMESVIEGELFTFENEFEFQGSLAAVRARVEQVSALMAKDDLRLCGDAT